MLTTILTDVGFFIAGVTTTGLTVAALSYRKLRRVKAVLSSDRSMDLSQFTVRGDGNVR